MPSSQAQAPGGFVSDVSSNAYNYAMGAVGTIAGPKTRRRVESSVDSLSSGKLYHLYFFSLWRYVHVLTLNSFLFVAGCRMYQRFRN